MTQDNKKPKATTFKSILKDVEKIFNVQLQTFTAEFLEHTTSEKLEKMIPQDVGDSDAWIEQHVAAFVEDEDPSVEDMVKGSAAIFMMAFMEQVFAHLGIDDDGDDDGGDDDGGDDGESDE